MDHKDQMESIFQFTYNKMMNDLRMEFLEQVKFYNSFQKHTISLNDAKEFFAERVAKEVDVQKVKAPVIQKFVLENTGEIGFKNRTAYNVVRAYLKDHPKATLKNLRDAFERQDLNLKRLFKEIDEIKEEEKKHPRRYFHKDDEVFRTADRKTVALTTQWGENFDDFCKVVEAYGYRIAPYDKSQN